MARRPWPSSSPRRTITGHGCMRCRRTLSQALRRKHCARSVILIYPISRAWSRRAVLVRLTQGQLVVSQALLRAERADARSVNNNGCGFKRPCRGRRSGAALRQGSAPARRPTPQPRVTFLNDRNSDISIWWRQPTTGAGPFPCCLRFAYFPALRPGHPLNRRTGAASG